MLFLSRNRFNVTDLQSHNCTTKQEIKIKKVVRGFGSLPTGNTPESELGHGAARTVKELGFDP